jgi:FixJ family two-component response regulator
MAACQGEVQVTTPMITIVDDDQSVRDGIVDLVTSMGYDVQAFSRADHFLRSSRLDRTSFLITDVRMPGMSGLDLLDQLAASGRQIPTIMITAFPTEAERARATQAGAIGYLVKPFDEGQLVACITSSIGPGQTNRSGS